MKLKNYQERTLQILTSFLTDAKFFGNAAAFERNQDAKGSSPIYQPLIDLENVPYVCLRLPTGGGKTLIGAQSIQIATENYLEEEYPFVLWIVPTKEIGQQTLKP